jgi:hypothetical protein
MYTDIPILTSTGVTLSLWVDCDGVERTKVTSDTTDFLLENLVVESSLEFTLTS